MNCQCGCGAELPLQVVGRPAKFAGDACRQRAHRRRSGNETPNIVTPTRAELFAQLPGSADPEELWQRIREAVAC